jgi:ATP/maltotriose-dependent transcriptional regulator MalT
MSSGRSPVASQSSSTFGDFLRYLRNRARLTQSELGRKVNYSEAQISRLEKNQRLPDPTKLEALFLDALNLRGESQLKERFLELASTARAQPGLADTTLTPAAQGTADPCTEDLEAIPAPPRHTVVRTRLLADLRKRLTSEHSIVICGLPGVGKTTLAASVAREYADHQLVCWITLTEGVTTSVDALLRRVACSLALHGQRQVEPLLQHNGAEVSMTFEQQLRLVGDALRHQPALICLDNAHLVRDDIRAEAMLAHLAAGTPARVMLASRERWPGGVGVLWLAGLEHNETRELMAQVDPPLPAELVDRLHVKTQGSPMLLRLALGQLPERPADAAIFVEHLETQPEVASYLLKTTLSRLGAPAWQLLSLLSVFRQPINLHDETLAEIAQANDGLYDLAGGLEEVQRRQLIDHPAWASLHPLIRQYVYTQLVSSLPRRRQLHLIAATWWELARGDPLEAAYHFARADQLSKAAAVLTAGTRTLVDRGQAFAAADLAGELAAQLRRRRIAASDLSQLLATRGDLLLNTLRAAEAEAAYREALAMSAAPVVRAQITWRLAESLLQRGRVPEALELCQRASRGLASGEKLAMAQLAAVESRAHLMLSSYDEAGRVAGSALELAAQIETVAPELATEVQARSQATLGLVSRLQGRHEAALEHLRQAIDAAQAVGLTELANRCLFNSGATLFERGDLETALNAYSEAAAKMEARADSYGSTRVLHAIAVIDFYRGNVQKALDTLGKVCAVKRQLGDVQGLAHSENQIALGLLALGRIAEAYTLVERLLADTARTGEQRSRGYFLDTLGVIHAISGEHAVAQQVFRDALALPGIVDNRRIQVLILTHLALSQLAGGNLREAEQLAADSICYGLGPEVEMEQRFLEGAIALARGWRTKARAAAIAMATRADTTGYRLYRPAADRLAAVSDNPPPIAGLPRLLWSPLGSGLARSGDESL